MERHEILGGKVHLFRRGDSAKWQAFTHLDNVAYRTTTREESLSRAKEIAEDWYLELRGKRRAGELKKEKTFAEAAALFEREFEIITEGERSPRYVKLQKGRLRVHLVPFFGKMGLSEITSGTVQDYRIHRHQQPDKPARSTMHQEIVALRQTLKAASRHGWITALPDLSEPFRGSGKVSHRAWFSKDEYNRLWKATQDRAKKPRNNRFKWESEQLHDYVLFMANTGLRPDEANRLQFGDVGIENDEATGTTILAIKVVEGKRGGGWCKSMPGAVLPFKRLKERLRKIESAEGETETRKPGPADLLFPGSHREIFNAVLDELNLKVDREGQPRTAYSLRHTYISLRLMEGADIYQIAKNCRTSVEMIEKFYASHIKDRIDAGAINMQRKTRKSTTASNG